MPYTPATNANALIALPIAVAAPIFEEALFRGILQDLILKRGVKHLIAQISPSMAKYVDSTIYTFCRILISSYAFSKFHELNRGLISDDYVDAQVQSTFYGGLLLGVIKETWGLSGAIGAHAFHNFTAILPDLVAKC